MSNEFELGINTFDLITDLTLYDSWLDVLKNNGFDYLRPCCPTFDSDTSVAAAKVNVLQAVEKGFKVTWGVTGGSTTLTAANWGDFETAVLSAATWSQANGVYEFQLGNEEELHNDNTTLTDAQVRINIKALATSVKAVFTNGAVTYACISDHVPQWITLGKGDIDLLSILLYQNHVDWQGNSLALFNEFGVNGSYIAEFSLNSTSLDTYSTNEDTQEQGVLEMINYFKNLGIERAFFFAFNSDEFGAMKDNGVYRKLWNLLKIQNDWKKRKTAGQKEIRGLSR